jgi:crotonobetainyl-CoA:carnitine CoA-transferase CaiB-like acyl-CoA transferase
MRSRKSGPLQGLRVVVLPWHISAKVMGMILADNGATVIELLPPGAAPEPGFELAESVWRRGKSLVAYEDEAQLARLIAEADVFATDFSRAEQGRMGADLDRLVERHPELICLHISGYGRHSAQEADEWSEMLLWARQGMYFRQYGYREGPKMPTFPTGTYATAFNGLTVLLAALHARHETGRGQIVETSLADGLAAQQTMYWYWSEHDKAADMPIDIRKGGMGRLVLDSYQCADAEWVHIHSGSKGGFSRLMALAELQDRIPPIPTEAASEIGQPIEPWQTELINETLPVMFVQKTRPEWLKILRDLDIPVMPDLLPGEVYEDPQVIENQLTTLVELPDGETVRGAGAALKFSETPGFAAPVAERTVDTRGAIEDLGKAAQRFPRKPFGTGALADRYPLAGVKIVDFGVFFAGPFASRLLADLGAEVIKIENLAGCPMRPVSQGRYFNAANHHKRMLALNLKKPESREVVERLVKWADVVQHNLRPGVAESLGMGYEDLRDLNPRMIYCHSPAFGSLGPYAGYPGFEPLSSAITGLLMRHEDARYVGPYSAIGSMDPGNGLLGAAGMLMALHHRDRTGEGQFLECPQMGSAILSTADTVVRCDGTIIDPYAADEQQYGFNWWTRLYEGSEGWLVVHAWAQAARDALLRITGAAAGDEIAGIAQWVAARPAAEAVAALRAVGVPAEPVAMRYRADDYFFDDENVRLGRVIEFEGHHKWGTYRDLGQFWRFEQSPLRLASDGRFAPEVGTFSREILREHGFDDAAIARLIEARAVGAPAAPASTRQPEPAVAAS